MEELLWEGFICDVYDLSKYLRREISWDNVHKKKVMFLVDTGASKSIVLREIIHGIRVMDLGETIAQGICEKPAKFKVVLVGLAINLENEAVASIHEVLVPMETKVKKCSRFTYLYKSISYSRKIKYGCTKLKNTPKNIKTY